MPTPQSSIAGYIQITKHYTSEYCRNLMLGDVGSVALIIFVNEQQPYQTDVYMVSPGRSYQQNVHIYLNQTLQFYAGLLKRENI